MIKSIKVYIDDFECDADIHYHTEKLCEEDCRPGMPGQKEITIDKILVYTNEKVDNYLISEIIRGLKNEQY